MNLKQKIRSAIMDGHRSWLILQRLEYQLKQDVLIDKIMHCTESGVSSERLCEGELIVSLTTYGRRFYDVAATIESIMQGTVKPNRIVLWLGEELKEKPLPITLQKQMKRGLEVEYVKDIRSYTKLVPCLKKYPEACIITIDDDMIYDYDLVEKLVNTHLEYPENIISNEIHRLVLDKSGKPVTFFNWKHGIDPEDDSPLNFLMGVGGVFYPPHALHDEVLNEDVFLNICKYADDVWFYAMALMKGTGIRRGINRRNGGHDRVTNWNVQDMGLLNINDNRKKCMNDIQLKAVFDKYNLYDKLK